MLNDKEKLSENESFNEPKTTDIDESENLNSGDDNTKNNKEKKQISVVKKLELKIKDFKNKINNYKSENKILSNKAENNLIEINSLKNEIKRINNEYVKKANSFASQAQNKVDEFRTKEQDKSAKKIIEIKKYGFQKTGEELIDILNQLNKVISFKSDNPAVNAYVTGFSMITQNFTNVLTHAGIKEIAVKIGEKFDGSKHTPFEIIKTSNKEQNDHIAEIIHNGYYLHDRVIKPVIVKVYKFKLEN